MTRSWLSFTALTFSILTAAPFYHISLSFLTLRCGLLVAAAEEAHPHNCAAFPVIGHIGISHRNRLVHLPLQWTPKRLPTTLCETKPAVQHTRQSTAIETTRDATATVFLPLLPMKILVILQKSTMRRAWWKLVTELTSRVPRPNLHSSTKSFRAPATSRAN
jgi:hypothetical protein